MQKSDPPKLTQKDVTNLINWKVECFNHIRWLERANWNGMTFIGPFTIAIIGFLAYYSFRLELPPQNDGKLYYSYAIIFILGLPVFFNMICVALLIRNRRTFLENLYQASIAEELLKKMNWLAIRSRPKNWGLEENPVFKKTFSLGSVFALMVIFHIFLITVGYIIMLYLAFSSMVNVVFFGVLISFCCCVYILYSLYDSYKNWWMKQPWSPQKRKKEFEKILK